MTAGDEPAPRVIQQARAAGASQVIQVAGNYYSAGSADTGATPTPAMQTLPRDVADFTGRETELQQLVEAASPGRVVGIHAVDGMAGVGKTALVTRAAHLLAGRFPDGQLFVQLHAHTPGRRPADPGSVLAALLASTGMAPSEIPPGLDELAQRWRDRLTGRKVLLVLDDATDHGQIEPLLPGSAGCLVLVTSRSRLIAFDGAEAIPLDTLPPGQAAGLFTRLSRRVPDPGAETDAVTELVRLCGCLPLAVALLAGRLAHHPACSITELAAGLAAARDRLAELAAGDRAVAAAFDLSYGNLPADRQRFFRRLGLHPGADIDACAVAALGDIPLHAARQHLDALYTDHLIDEPMSGRYRLHDLVRAYARDLAARNDPADDGVRATGRLLDYYQRTAEAADRHLTRHTRPGSLPSALPDLATREDALTWMRAERSNLLACIQYASTCSGGLRAARLTAAMAAFLHQEGPWQLAVDLHHAAATAAHLDGDRLGEAGSLHDAGRVQAAAGDYPAARGILEQALALYRDLGDRLGEANVLDDLCGVLYPTGHYPAAASVLEQALALYRDLGDAAGEANALGDLGRVRYMTGDYDAAAGLQEQALASYRSIGSGSGEASAVQDLGRARAGAGDYAAAASLLEQALALYRSLGDRHGEATSLHFLGAARAGAGDYPAAASLLEQALARYRDLHDRHGETNGLLDLGSTRLAAGDSPAAATLLEEALTRYRDLHDPLGEASALHNLGRVRAAAGNHSAAATLLEQALTQYRRLGNRHAEAGSLHHLGRVLAEAGDRHAAACLLDQALAIYRDLGDRHAEAAVLNSIASGQAPKAAQAPP